MTRQKKLSALIVSNMDIIQKNVEVVPFVTIVKKNHRIGIGHRFLECEYSRKQVQTQMARGEGGYHSCSQGMADEEASRYDVLVHSCYKESKKYKENIKNKYGRKTI